MTGGDRRVFAGRRISLPSVRDIAIVVVIGFAAGLGVGWGSSEVADRLTAPDPVPSPTPSPTPTHDPDVVVPPMDPITRTRDAGDALAGILDLNVLEKGEQSFTVVTKDGEPSGEAASVRWVRVEYEDGLGMDGDALASFVLNTLNDPRGWGARGRYEFVPTEGASDIRIAITSPYTAALRCPEPHTPAHTGAIIDEEPTNTADAQAESTLNAPTAGATPSPTASAQEEPCAQRGVVMLSQYDWITGVAGFGEDRTAARQYLISHFVGHVLGEQDGICGSGLAQVMTDQVDLPQECEPNPWPWPDEPVAEAQTSPSPSARGDEDE